MLTSNVIQQIYKKHNKPCGSQIENEVQNLVSQLKSCHKIRVENKQFILDNLSNDSPFHSLPLDKICGITEFESVYAIVIPTCIIFLNKKNADVNVHIKFPKEPFLERMYEKIKNVLSCK